jgi:aldose 1-epimerase
VLEDGRGGRVEIWPGQGFNAYRWQAPSGAELLYATDTFFKGDRPSRSGIPILFPFPNRIRGARYDWQERSYELTANDPAGNNAIHGFAFNAPWQVIDGGADGGSAWATGEFLISRDARAVQSRWPADARLRVTYRLRGDSLSLKANVSNRSTASLPFGLGYHPYFNLAPFGGEAAVVAVHASEYWELEESLPTGTTKPVAAGHDLSHGKLVTGLQVDDVYTKLAPAQSQFGRGLVASLRHATGKPVLDVWTGNEFGQLVAFIPPHRQALCLEPYSCVTDAINLQARGVETGLVVLPRGEKWRGDVVFAYAEADVDEEPATVSIQL